MQVSGTTVRSSAVRFAPRLSEPSQVYPGCYGAELAWWLCIALMQRGVETSYPNHEDWGWFLENSTAECEYWLCCGNVDGSRDPWQAFLQPQARGLFGRRGAPVAEAAPLLDALRSVLDGAEGISDVAWSRE